MKITRIRLEAFRAFDEPFELDLAGGKHLLMYGENGSGKSSLFLALKRFFEERGCEIGTYRNLFSDATRTSQVALYIRGTDARGAVHDREFVWGRDSHPLVPPRTAAPLAVGPLERAMLVEAARRSGFLEYRDVLRLSLYARPLPRHPTFASYHRQPFGYGDQDLSDQVFDAITWAIVQGCRVATGPINKTIGELVRNVWQYNPTDRYKRSVTRALDAIAEFNNAFSALLPQLEEKVALLIEHFENQHVGVAFEWQPVTWNRDHKRLEKAHLMPRIRFRHEDLANRSHEVLNEARLSAIGLCVFFAGILLADIDTDNAAYPRFIVLDDALIGLDLQNRIPILNILRSPLFRHFQVFLFTHDRVWFDLARGHLPTGDGWVHHELIADETTGKLIPRLRPSIADLERAREHLANGDLRAAGVYARAAFECRLQNVCEDNGIEIPYRKDTKEVSVDKLWQGVLARQRRREVIQASSNQNAPDFIGATLIRNVETMRSTVLNKLSHANSAGLVAADVLSAIATVEALVQHRFPRS